LGVETILGPWPFSRYVLLSSSYKTKKQKKRKKTKTNTKKKREGKKGVWPREVHLATRKLFQPLFLVFELWDIGNDCILGEEMVVIALYLAI